MAVRKCKFFYWYRRTILDQYNFFYLGVAPLLLAVPGFPLQLRLAAKAGQSGVFATIPNARAVSNYKQQAQNWYLKF
jgi:hypothetical protein